MPWWRGVFFALLATAWTGVTAQGTTVLGDLVCGTQVTDPARWTLTVGYAHRIKMRNSTRDQAKMYVAQFPERCVQTYGIGVLDPVNMYKWPDSETPAVFHGYSPTVGRLWHTKQIQSLTHFMIKWADTHGVALFEDLPRQAIFEAYLDGAWVGIPWLLSARSSTHNMTTYARCGIPVPPPWGNMTTYTWKAQSDAMVKLAQCGVKKPMILEECMTHPWLVSILHDRQVYVYEENNPLRSGWRDEAFVDAVFDIVWPFLKAANQTDPDASMVKQWINFHSPIMQQYQQTPIEQWPAIKPTPIPRSDCDIAMSVEGASSHYGGKSSALRLVDSPGSVNSFQSWYWLLSSRIATPEMSLMATDWLYFMTDNNNPVMYQYNVATRNVVPLESVQKRPEMKVLMSSTTGQITDRLKRKGRVINFPGPPSKYIDKFEGNGVVSRFFHDLMFKAELGPHNWDNDTTVHEAIRMARDRAVAMLEYIALPDCTMDNTVLVRNAGQPTKRAEWDPAVADRTCQVSEESLLLLNSSPAAVQSIPCEFGRNGMYVLQSCRPSGGVDAVPAWNGSDVGVECLVTAQSVLPDVAVINCPHDMDNADGSISLWFCAALVVTTLVGVAAVVAVKRSTPILRASSWDWSLCLLVGCSMLAAAAPMLAGERSTGRCRGFTFLVSFGLAVVMGCLFVKLMRVDDIYNSRILQVKMHNLAIPFAAICFVNGALWAWSIGTSDGLRYVPVVDNQVHNLVVAECEYGSAAAVGSWLAFLALLTGVNVYLIRRLLKVPQQFSETPTVAVITAALPLVLAIGGAVAAQATSDKQRGTTFAIVCLFLSVVIAGVYFGLKLVRVFGGGPGGDDAQHDTKLHTAIAGSKGSNHSPAHTGQAYQVNNNNSSNTPVVVVQASRLSDFPRTAAKGDFAASLVKAPTAVSPVAAGTASGSARPSSSAPGGSGSPVSPGSPVATVVRFSPLPGTVTHI